MSTSFSSSKNTTRNSSAFSGVRSQAEISWSTDATCRWSRTGMDERLGLHLHASTAPGSTHSSISRLPLHTGATHVRLTRLHSEPASWPRTSQQWQQNRSAASLHVHASRNHCHVHGVVGTACQTVPQEHSAAISRTPIKPNSRSATAASRILTPGT